MVLFASEEESAEETAVETPEYAFVVDITLYDENGVVWQPDEPVTVTLDAYTLGLDDGDAVQILHEHDGEEDDLGVYTAEDGELTFDVDGFSIVRGVLMETVELDAEVSEKAEILYAADGVIYFDLAKVDVNLTGDSYSDYSSNGSKVSGEHKNSNQYYVYRSAGNGTVYDEYGIPTYEKECREGTVSDTRQTVAQYGDYCISLKEERGVKHSTVFRYRELMERITPHIGHVKLKDLRPDMLNMLNLC